MVRLWFEALPSRKGASPDRIAQDVERLAPLAGLGVERLLVPEVLDGDYATVDPAAFAAVATRRTGIPSVVALGTRHQDPGGLARRIQATRTLGIRDLLLVGGRSGQVDYPGPSVTEALQDHGGRHHVGVVTIPTRHRPGLPEAARLVEKQRAGARFAVSQILLEAEHALALRRAQMEALDGEEPLPILWSLSPVVGAGDLAFLERLGVHVPPGLHDTWSRLDPRGREAASADLAVSLARTLAEGHEAEGLGSLGFCVSHVRMANVDAAVRLVARLARPGS